MAMTLNYFQLPLEQLFQLAAQYFYQRKLLNRFQSLLKLDDSRQRYKKFKIVT